MYKLCQCGDRGVSRFDFIFLETTVASRLSVSKGEIVAISSHEAPTINLLFKV